MKRLLLAALVLLTAGPLPAAVFRFEQSSGTTTGWVTAVHLPTDLLEIRGLLIVGNGSGADETGAVNDPELLAFARSIGFGVMAFGRWGNLYSTTERNRFLAALSSFAAQSGRSELVNVPWIAFGFSQGGGQAYSLNYHFPVRTIAIGVNKAGFSFLSDGSDVGGLDQAFGSRPASPSAVFTPALLVAGQNDDPGRLVNLSAAHANNRAIGAPWAWLIEEGAGHEKGQALRWFLPFFEEIAATRYPSNLSARNGQPNLLPVSAAGGWLIDQPTQTSGFLNVISQAAFLGDPLTRGWVPSARIAALAQAFGSYQKAGTLSATVQGPLSAPATVNYSANVTAAGWTRIEFFDGSAKLGELTPAGGSSWTRTVAASTGFAPTYAIVTRDDTSQRFLPLQTVWVNGASGFTMASDAPEAAWIFRSTANATGNISGSWGNAANWNTGAVPSGQNLRADFSRLDFGATSEITLDGARTAAYLQFGDAVGGQWTALRPGSGGSLTMNASSGAAVIQLANGGGQTLHFNGVSPQGTVPLELIGNGNAAQPNTIILALAGSYAGAVTLRNGIEWHVPATGSFGTARQGTNVQSGSSLNFREWMVTGAITEPLTIAGFGVSGRPALRVGSAANATVTLTGNLTLGGPVAMGVAATSGNGSTLLLANRIAAAGSDVYFGLLRSSASDPTLPAWGLDTTALDDAPGATSWGAVVIGANATFDGAPTRVVQGLGVLRLEGAANRLPISTRLILNGGTGSPNPALTISRVVLAGISQEVAALESFSGNTTLLSIVGGSATPARLIVNNAANSTFSGALGGSGTLENQLSLEKRGAGDLMLNGNLTYIGGTRIAQGRLVLTGPLPAGALVIEGSGQLSSAGSLVLPATTTLRRAAQGIPAAVESGGSVTLSGDLHIELNGPALAAGDVVPLISAAAVSLQNATITLPPRTSEGPALRLRITPTAADLVAETTTLDQALFLAGWLGASEPLTAPLVTSDPDADGLSNIVEYALGTDLTKVTARAVSQRVSGGALQIQFTRQTGAQDVVLTVEAASHLAGPWTSIASHREGAGWTGSARVEEQAPGPDGVALVTVTDPSPAGVRFLRLRAGTIP